MAVFGTNSTGVAAERNNPKQGERARDAQHSTWGSLSYVSSRDMSYLSDRIGFIINHNKSKLEAVQLDCHNGKWHDT